MKLTIIMIALALTGCGSISGIAVPSINACQHVQYERTGPDVKLSAECKV
jgi:uncharacterized protein YcfL